jgi:D-sedoheptulose 7-phosphate isomerase
MNSEGFEMVVRNGARCPIQSAPAIIKLLRLYGIPESRARAFLRGRHQTISLGRTGATGQINNHKAQFERLGVQVEVISVGPQHEQSDAEGLQSPPTPSFANFFESYAQRLTHILQTICVEDIERVVSELVLARQSNRQIFVFGNGGSASTASHMVNDLSKPVFDDDAFSFRVIGLSDNIATITANGNDYGYDSIFANQLRNLVQPNDLVIGISSSGNSPNIIKAINLANSRGAMTIGIAGFGGGVLAEVAHHTVIIPSEKGEYGYHEDVSLILNHAISLYIRERDASLVNRPKP